MTEPPASFRLLSAVGDQPPDDGPRRHLRDSEDSVIARVASVADHLDDIPNEEEDAIHESGTKSRRLAEACVGGGPVIDRLHEGITPSLLRSLRQMHPAISPSAHPITADLTCILFLFRVPLVSLSPAPFLPFSRALCV